MKLLFINAFNCYKLNSPYTLSFRGPRTHLRITRPLRAQLLSFLLLHDPKLDFTPQIYLAYLIHAPIMNLSNYLEPRSIYTIPWSTDHG